MRNKAGVVFMLLGTALIFGALSLFIYNLSEAAAAERASERLLDQLVEVIEKHSETADNNISGESGASTDSIEADAFEMTEVEIDGYAYIGYLSIPKLGLEFPVMADWDYDRLRIAPCRYTGSVKGGDLVLMGHNYNRHFGQLSDLAEGDSVLFTDMDGVVTFYKVTLRDVLDPYDVEGMTSGVFDLTLFTCDYSGQKRLTVYCDRTKLE